MHKIFELQNVVENEIGRIVEKGQIKADEWDNLCKAVDIMKDIETIRSMQEFDDYGGSSQRYDRDYSRNSYGNYYGNSYERGGSYANDMNDSRGSRQSRGDNMDHSIKMLEEKLDRTSDPTKRDALMKTIEMMKYER